MPPGAAASLESYTPDVQIEIIMDDNQVTKIDEIEAAVGKQFADGLSALVHEGLGFRQREIVSGKRAVRAKRQPVSPEV